MVSINNVDHVLALVRGQVERLARDRRAAGGKKAGRSERAGAIRASARSRLDALATIEELGEESFAQLLVGALLSEEFGDDAANDPRFQQIAARTAEIMRTDPNLRAAMRALRGDTQRAARDDRDP